MLKEDTEETEGRTFQDDRPSPWPLRVLAVIPGDENEPSNMIFARRQVAALAKRGINCRSFYLSSRTSPKALLQELKRFRRTLKEFDPHIIHAHYGTMTALFCALGTLRPLVISFRGSDLNPTSNVSALRSLSGRLLSQVATLRAEHIICVSEQLRKRLWLTSLRNSIIFDGINLSLFKPMPRAEARDKLGWSHDGKFIFFNLGGRPAGKRLALAEQAVEYARKAFPNLDLVPVTRVSPDKIPLLMNACDCLLLTSEWEGSPTVVKEALACNLPVISVDVGDVKALVHGVQPSRIVAAEVEAIGEAIVDVLKAGVRSNGSMRAGDMSESMTTDRVLSIYEEIVSHRTGSLALR